MLKTPKFVLVHSASYVWRHIHLSLKEILIFMLKERGNCLIRRRIKEDFNVVVRGQIFDFFRILSIQLADLFVVHCVINVSTLIVLNVLCAKHWDIYIYIQLTQSSGLESSLYAGLVSWIKFWLILPRFFIYLHALDLFLSYQWDAKTPYFHN